MIDIRPVLIMAGGTGGHVYPALAVAERLRTQGIPVVWMGTRMGLEARVVPEAGYPMRWLNVAGVRGKGLVSRLLSPLRLLRACWQAMLIIRQVKPSAVLGMGGFVSGPGGLMAWLLRLPLLIHEQNAIAGLTNRWLSKIADRVMVAFPNTLGPDEIHVGNPVRRDIIEVSAPATRLARHEGALRLLVIGGSLGAVRLNEIIPEAVAKMDPGLRPEIIHQTGKSNIDATNTIYEQHGVTADIRPFIEDMAEVYAWADLVICRAGAMTVFELAAVGVASILIPYPYAVDDHQTANALYLVDNDAAIMRQQSGLDSDWLSDALMQLTAQRDRLKRMSRAARALAMPDSADVVCAECMQAGGMA